MSDPAPLAEDISGTNENTLPAWIEPNVTLWDMMSMVANKVNNITYHKTNEELENAILLARNENRAIPEVEGNDKEYHGLGHGIEGITPDSYLVGFP